MTLNQVYYTLIRLNNVSLNALAVRVGATGGTAGAVLRMGLFAADGVRNNPGTLIVDAGTTPATTAYAGAAITITATAALSGLYWFACVAQVAASTALCWPQGSVGMAAPAANDGTIYGNAGMNMYVTNAVSGAFASSPIMTYLGNTAVIRPAVAGKVV